MICYDGDANQIYSFTDFNKALASIEGSIRSYYGDENEEFDAFCDVMTAKLRELRNAPCVPMKFNNLTVIVYNWEIDSTNPIHKILLECYNTADIELKGRIESLFAESTR